MIFITFTTINDPSKRPFNLPSPWLPTPVDQAFTACPSTRYKLESEIVAPDLQDTGLQQTSKTIEKSMCFTLKGKGCFFNGSFFFGVEKYFKHTTRETNVATSLSSSILTSWNIS